MTKLKVDQFEQWIVFLLHSCLVLRGGINRLDQAGRMMQEVCMRSNAEWPTDKLSQEISLSLGCCLCLLCFNKVQI